MFHVEREEIMVKKVNIADKDQAMELLKQLYGPTDSKNAQGATISENTTRDTPRKERGTVAYKMGVQPTHTRGCDPTYSKRR